MSKQKETLETLSKFELVIPARQILDAILESPDFLEAREIDEKRAKELKIAISAENALVRAFQAKSGYFKLVGVTQKLKYFRKKK